MFMFEILLSKEANKEEIFKRINTLDTDRIRAERLENGNFQIIFNYPCKFLKKLSNGAWSCTVYNKPEERPKMCFDFPYNEEHFKKFCIGETNEPER